MRDAWAAKRVRRNPMRRSDKLPIARAACASFDQGIGRLEACPRAWERGRHLARAADGRGPSRSVTDARAVRPAAMAKGLDGQSARLRWLRDGIDCTALHHAVTCDARAARRANVSRVSRCVFLVARGVLRIAYCVLRNHATSDCSNDWMLERLSRTRSAHRRRTSPGRSRRSRSPGSCAGCCRGRGRCAPRVRRARQGCRRSCWR